MAIHAVIERVRPAIGQGEGVLLIWADQGLGLKAEDFDLTRLGPIDIIENNPRIPGRADIWLNGTCPLRKGEQLLLNRRPQP